MKANLFWLLVASLALWRMTHLLIFEDGPWSIFARIRRLSGASFWTTLTGCFYCMSFWLAAPCALFLGENWKEQLLLWPALSGAAILMERATGSDSTAPAAYTENEAASAPYIEEEQETHDVLRSR
jgi:hypothetical protein